MGVAPAYELTALGWLMFEQLCAGWLRRAAGVEPERWAGSADRHRHVVVETGLRVAGARLRAPTVVTTAWGRPGRLEIEAVADAWHAARAARDGRSQVRSMLVLTDLPADQLRGLLETARRIDYLADLPALEVMGASELGAAIEADPELVLEHPFVLGVRRGGPAIPKRAAEASELDLDAALELARVFVPHRPYRLSLAVLRAHGFCVLTGPPEMGKTATARMIALALLTAGWEVHECTRPEQVMQSMRADRSQLFVADDAFGSTEYRPESAERWARALPEILRAADDRHWLIWTSRPTPLKAGLRAVHRERGGERFPAPAQVHVDAADLDTAEKALILFRHAKAARLDRRALRIVRRRGNRIVEHPHFTPERIRRFVARRLPQLASGDAGIGGLAEAIREEIELPTDAMAASYAALSPSQRAVLTAMLDCPAGAVAERELAAAARRHAPVGLERAPFDLVDRLSDHFLRMTSATTVAWVHPSWRDLVIDELARAPAERRSFLSRCGHHGALLALSTGGGAVGERVLPLLAEDADWDALGDRMPELIRSADERGLAELLAALRAALDGGPDPRLEAELRALAGLVTQLAARTRPAQSPAGVRLLEEWLRLAALLPDNPRPPWLTATWVDLLPAEMPRLSQPSELARYGDWLSLVEALHELRPGELGRLGFPGRQRRIARELAIAAQPLLDSEPNSPRAVMVSRLLLRATRVLDLTLPALQLAADVDLDERLIDARESEEGRQRHQQARADSDALVKRVLADL